MPLDSILRWSWPRDRWERGILIGAAIAVVVAASAVAGTLRTRATVHKAAIRSLTNYAAVGMEQFVNGYESLLRQSFVPIMPPPDYVEPSGARDPLPVSDMIGTIARLQRDPCRCSIPPGTQRGLPTRLELHGHGGGRQPGSAASRARCGRGRRGSAPSRQPDAGGLAIRLPGDGHGTGRSVRLLHRPRRLGDRPPVRVWARDPGSPHGRAGVPPGVPVACESFPGISSAWCRRTTSSSRSIWRRAMGRCSSPPRPPTRTALPTPSILPTLRGGLLVRAHLNPRIKDALIPGGYPREFRFVKSA